MSLVRFLLYSNQFDVEGLVATTSTWLKTGPRPDVILSVLDAYEQVQPNLLKHAPGFPAAADLRKLVAAGQPAYGMASVGADRMTPGAELILRAAGRQDARPLWVLAWGGTNTLAQALIDRPRDAHGGRGRGDRLEAARLRDCRPGRLRRLASAGVPEPPVHRLAGAPERRGVLPRHVDRHQRRPVLQERAGRRLLDVHRPVGQREHPEQGAARQAVSLSLLHPRGRHAVVPEPHRQRAGWRDEPGLRRLGRTVCLAHAARRGAGVLDPGRRLLRRAGQLARHGTRHRRQDLHLRPGHDLAMADGVPARLRRADGLDDQAAGRGQPQSAGRRERQARHRTGRDHRAGRRAARARRRRHGRPGRPRAEVHLVLLP